MSTKSDAEIHYISIHIRNELKYLLCGAKVWQLIEDKKIVDELHVQVYAMASCFVHIRNLYLYFTRRDVVSIANAYNIEPQLPVSSLFARDKRTIEAKVMHLNPLSQRESDRSINKNIIEYTEDILRIIAEHLRNLKTINPDAYKALLGVTRKCYAEAAAIVPDVPNSEVFKKQIFENQIMNLE